MKRINSISINGRFLEQNITGVQRYALEIIKSLDSLIKNESELPPVKLLIPQSVTNIPQLKNIEILKIGKHSGILWEQLDFPLYLKKNKSLPVNLCNSTPLLYPKGITCIHDITYKVNPDFITTKHLFFAKIYHLLQYKVALKKSLHIFTVSEFSKKEIIKVYKVDENRISVSYNGWQHFSVDFPSSPSFEHLYPSLTSGGYFFSLATSAKNKNFPWIVKAAQNNPKSTFVVAGKIDLKKLGNNIGDALPKNLTVLGYIPDLNAKLLMKNCRAFIFPSLYEGFGIPPLEALALGARVICSNVSCLPEIFQDCVHYINPFAFPPNFNELLQEKVSSPEKILNIYQWDKSAQKYLDSIKKILKV